jgi:hypothetical protein
VEQSERTKLAEEAAKKAGLVRIHPLVPADKRDQALEYCKGLRDTHEMERGNDDE